MLDEATRTAILQLAARGMGSRRIASTLELSRGAVRGVLASGEAAPPRIDREEKAEPWRQEIVELYARCKGNLVRVHEELEAAGAQLSYQALTAYCRRHALVQEPKLPAGSYHFEPGEEMQHDTSPHDVKLSGRTRRVQTASLVLCYSRMLFFQHYPRFDRLHCKFFLADALQYLGAAAGRCMIDNTSVIVLHGSGARMVPVPEMAAFASRYDFAFAAHAIGDADRSARVERPFSYIENNFLAGRSFEGFEQLNAEARAWCDKVNAKHRRHLHASPRELFARERPHLKALPEWVPPLYALHHRIVDVEGYVRVHTNRYTVPYKLGLIGKRVEVRETAREIEIYSGPRCVARHRREPEPRGVRVSDPSHRPPRGQGARPGAPGVEEQQLLRLEPELSGYIEAVKKRHRGRATTALRRLLRMRQELPREPFIKAVRRAHSFGMCDLERLESMVLKNVASDFFTLPLPGHDPDEDCDD